MKKTRFLMALFAVLFGLSSQAQNSQLIKTYRSGKSALDQAAAIEGKLPHSLSTKDRLAQEKILYQANPKRVAEIKAAVRESEALTPSMITDMDSTYPDPKLSEWYPEIAAQQGWDSVFHFTVEPFPAIGFEYLTEKVYKEYAEPSADQKKDKEQMLRYLTIRAQQDLWKSDYLYLQEIPRLFEERNNLWLSLTEDLKEQVRGNGYCAFWRQQEQCYLHKFRSHWDCSCPEKPGDIPDTSTCGTVKSIVLKEGERDLDQPTQIWIRLNHGDLTAAKDALDLGYGTWGNVRDHLIQQAIFFELATRNRQMITLVRKTKTQRNKNDLLNDQMRLGIVRLYKEAKALGDTKYYDRIGITDSMIIDLQAYYHCILHVATVDDTVPAPESHDMKPQTESVPKKESAKSFRPAPHSSQTITVIRNNPAVGKLVTEGKPYDVYGLDSAVDEDLKRDARNREGMNLCVETRVIDSLTIEIEFKSCGNAGEATFDIGIWHTEKAKNFFKYCTNSFDDKFYEYRALVDTGYHYDVLIIGTADTIPYSRDSAKNAEQESILALKRAGFVRDNVGQKALASVGGIGNIHIDKRINWPRREVFVRIRLIKPAR